MLMSDDVTRGSLCATDPVTARIEDLQFALGEGPCVDAHNQGQPIFEPHLAEPRPLSDRTRRPRLRSEC